MILLDTDILSLHFASHPRVTARIEAMEGERATTVISRIEVLQGRLDSVVKAADGTEVLLAQERLASAEEALAKFRIVPFDAAAAATFDGLRQNKKLKKIGLADLLIASIALAHRAILVTRNLRHFRQVPDLRLENWAD